MICCRTGISLRPCARGSSSVDCRREAEETLRFCWATCWGDPSGACSAPQVAGVHQKCTLMPFLMESSSNLLPGAAWQRSTWNRPSRTSLGGSTKKKHWLRELLPLRGGFEVTATANLQNPRFCACPTDVWPDHVPRRKATYSKARLKGDNCQLAPRSCTDQGTAWH